MPEVTRRGFLGACIGAGAAGAIASLPATTWIDTTLAAKERPLQDGAGILVLITLYGGNDGLNTVIPFADKTYQDARPDLAYSGEKVFRLDAEYGLNPGMRGMADMFQDESLAIVRGVGYPRPDRSHFRSIDIWQSASLEASETTGWIGRWLDATDQDPLGAMQFGRAVRLLAVGEKTVGALHSPYTKPQIRSTEFFASLSRHHEDDSPAMRMVCDSYRDAVDVNNGLAPLYADDEPLSERPDSQDNELAVQLDAVAACIAARVPTRVYSVELGGFDTHANERGTQQELLTKLDRAVTRFRKQISSDEHSKNVVIMAYSEFGRRVKANASDGTDHGTAGPVFVLGDRVKGGFYGDDPSLTDLKDDDLKVTTDFRDVYNEILLRGLKTDPEPVLGKKRKEIGFLKS